MDMNIDPEWLLKAAENEGNGIISVGGLVVEMGLMDDNDSLRARVAELEARLASEQQTNHLLRLAVGNLEARVKDDAEANHWLLADARAEVARKAAVLREVEWSGRSAPITVPICPACLHHKREGHAPGCRLAAALAGPPAPGGD